MKDAIGNEVCEGDTVAFMHKVQGGRYAYKGTKLYIGKIIKMNPKKATIEWSNTYGAYLNETTQFYEKLVVVGRLL